MKTTYETQEQKEKVVLIAVQIDHGLKVESSLQELAELVDTAGGESVGFMIQNREKVHPGTYFGKGKIQELLNLVDELGADTVVCDDELSPAQLKNLEELLAIKVIDRTILILDIFAARASTKEGKLQVELAQLRYRASRLVGLRNSLSRLGGSSSGLGIGSKGPGEKKLELDRRLIKDRIAFLNGEIEDVVRAREVLRKQRDRNTTPVVAIVGYTNAGKSTLLNGITDAGVLSANKLFATLDPTTRGYEFTDGQKVLFTDTVGFINKLPHHLINAFRSTLEEAKYADIILHVVDGSNDDYKIQMRVVYETLSRLEVENIPIITAFNKMDKLEDTVEFIDPSAKKSVSISAKEKIGFEELMEVLEQEINQGFETVERLFSYEEANKIQIIRKYGQLFLEDYREDGIFVKASIPKELSGSIS